VSLLPLIHSFPRKVQCSIRISGNQHASSCESQGTVLISCRDVQKFVTPPSVIVWRVYEARERAEPVALHNDEHHNLCTSLAIGANINLKMMWCARLV